MAAAPRILIAGGSGVFGRLLAREILDTTAARLLLAGRDQRRLIAICRALDAPGRVEPLALDLRAPKALMQAARDCLAVVCAAGPFQSLPRGLPAAAVAAGAHWLDLADDPGWVLPLLSDRALDNTAADAGLAVVSGLSTVPALSGALVRWCCARLPDTRTVRITLYIGNRNAKGTAAIASALAAGFSDPQPVNLPGGRRNAYRFRSPDKVLLQQELGLAAEFRVVFEWEPVNRLMAALGPLGSRLNPAERWRLARALSFLAAPLNHLGSDTGCLQAEVWANGGGCVRAALLGAGQRLVVLPCALALEALLGGELQQRGVVHPACWLQPEEWLQRLALRGIQFVHSPTQPPTSN